MLAASLNAFFCASPIYGSADDFTFPLDITVSREVTPAAKQQVGETRKKRLAQRLAFFRFDNSLGIIKGEQPLIRASRASKVAGAFLVLFWHAKENLALPQQRFNPRHKRTRLLKNTAQALTASPPPSAPDSQAGCAAAPYSLRCAPAHSGCGPPAPPTHSRRRCGAPAN